MKSSILRTFWPADYYLLIKDPRQQRLLMYFHTCKRSSKSKFVILSTLTDTYWHPLFANCSLPAFPFVSTFVPLPSNIWWATLCCSQNSWWMQNCWSTWSWICSCLLFIAAYFNRRQFRRLFVKVFLQMPCHRFYRMCLSERWKQPDKEESSAEHNNSEHINFAAVACSIVDLESFSKSNNWSSNPLQTRCCCDLVSAEWAHSRSVANT